MALFDKNKLTGALDKAKDMANKAADAAKDGVEKAQAAYQEKKEADAAHKAEMEALAEAKAKEIIDAIIAYENDGAFFKNTNKEEMCNFTKEFYDKILLPASSVALTKISMYPYIDQKALGKLAERLVNYDSSETVFLHLKAENKQDIVITDKALYFSLALEEDTKYFAKGKVSLDEISSLSTKLNGEKYEFLCDEFVLASFKVDKVTSEDFTTLNNYFKCIKEHDFVITDEEVDSLIKEKIGDKIFGEVKKYMIYDDERLIYWAWGCNSLTAKDYIVCTDKQIIVVDREMGGMTENVKQLYYEDITSANIIQNTNSGDLAVDLLANAITAATKTCDFELSVAGSQLKINTLYKVEAERITAVYHEMKKQIKQGQSQPQVVVQQSAEESPIEKLQKLSQLKDAGILSEEEFNQKKAELMAQI